MNTFRFENIHRETPKFDADQVVLWVWNADKIPPHLGISVGKTYHSLTYKGVDHTQVGAMLRKAKRSAIPMVFIQLLTSVSEETPEIFARLERAKPGGATCLTPIREALEVTEEPKQLSELLHMLNKEGLVGSVYGLHLGTSYNALPEYGWLDIVKRIQLLDASK